MCGLCLKTHKNYSDNEVHTIVCLQATQKSTPIRQVECNGCNSKDLADSFCNECGVLTCKYCRSSGCHSKHQVVTLETACKASSQSLNKAIERAKASIPPVNLALNSIQSLSSRVKDRCQEVEKEVHDYIQSYKSALDEHEKYLLDEVTRVRDRKLNVLNEEFKILKRRIEQTEAAMDFTEAVMTDGSDLEALNVMTPLIDRLEWCASRSRPQTFHPTSEGLRFLPEEKAPNIRSHQMFGVVTTQFIAPANCFLQMKGFSECRQNKVCTLTLVTCDDEGEPLPHGGEKVTAEIRYKDVSQRLLPVYTADNGDGTYSISFTPDSPGSLSLMISVRQQHVQGSPFTVFVPTFRTHQGIFHCCTFCSSGGSKKATCGCAGKMPGGYNGCGHGHNGHPGRRHWSCCGNIEQSSECTKTVNYQLSL